MAKTAAQVEDDVFQLIRSSVLFTKISGSVYHEETRPRDSQLEDVVVIYTAGIPSQIQTGVVTINIYVPFIDPYLNGVWVKDVERCKEIETLAQAWVETLTAKVSNYSFELKDTIHTTSDHEIGQSFVVVKLSYRYFGEDNAPLNTKQE